VDALGRYLVYFGPRHLLTQGDPYPVPSTGRFGLLYWPVLPLALLGLTRLLTRRSRADLLILWWLLVYPIPSALTGGAHPDWLRAACGIGVWELIAGAGAVMLFDRLRPRLPAGVLRAGVAASAALVVVNAGWFLWDYSYRFPDRAAWAFADGAREAVRRVAELEGGYERVVLPTQVPAIHDVYLFYSRYDPGRLHREGLEDLAAPGDWADVRGFGRHRVCDPAACCDAGDLCLVRGQWQGTGERLAEIRDRTGRTAFTIIAGR
jgi:hypothetical protein